MSPINGWRKELAVLLLSTAGAYGISMVAVALPGIRETEPLSGYGIFIIAFLLVYTVLTKILPP